MEDLKYRQGETLQLGFEGDEDAESITFIVKISENAVTPSIIETANFVNSEATIDAPIDIPEGEYIYQVTYIYTDGSVEKYPNTEDCDDEECGFPAFVVCPALDPGVS